jgi:hypothetical protein
MDRLIFYYCYLLLLFYYRIFFLLFLRVYNKKYLNIFYIIFKSKYQLI